MSGLPREMASSLVDGRDGCGDGEGRNHKNPYDAFHRLLSHLHAVRQGFCSPSSPFSKRLHFVKV